MSSKKPGSPPRSSTPKGGSGKGILSSSSSSSAIVAMPNRKPGAGEPGGKSIAGYVNDLLSEPMYGEFDAKRGIKVSKYNDKLQNRISGWNASQLQGLHSHFDKTQKKSLFPLWKNANQKLISEMAATLQQRSESIRLEIKRREDEKMKEFQVREKKKQKKIEAARVMNTILKNAHARATKEIEVEEQERWNIEKADIQARIFIADIKQERYGKITAAYFLCGEIGMMASGLVWYITASACIFILFSTIYICWKLYNMTKIEPMVVTKEQIQARVDERSDVIKAELIEEMRDKERKFQERLIRDKIEKKFARIKRIKDEKKKAEESAKLKAEWEAKQNQMALEILDKLANTDAVVFDKKPDDGDDDGLIICPVNLRSLIVYDLPTDRVIFNNRVYATVSVMYTNTHDHLGDVSDIAWRQSKTFDESGARRYHAANELQTVWQSENQKWLGDDNDFSFDVNNIDGKKTDVVISSSHIKKAKEVNQLDNVYLKQLIDSGKADSYFTEHNNVPHGLTVNLENKDILVIKLYSEVKYEKIVQVGECTIDTAVLFSKNSKIVDANSVLSIDFQLQSIFTDEFGRSIPTGNGSLYLQYLNSFEGPEEEEDEKEEGGDDDGYGDQVEGINPQQRSIVHDILIMSASNLPKTDGILGTADPYIAAKWDDSEIGRTPVMKRNLNPSWENQRFPLSISQLSSSSSSAKAPSSSVSGGTMENRNRNKNKSNSNSNSNSNINVLDSKSSSSSMSTFSSSSSSSSKLTIEVWDWDLIGRPNFLGGVEVTFEEVNSWIKETEEKMGALVVRRLKLGKLLSMDSSVSQSLVNGNSTVEIGFQASELQLAADECKEEAEEEPVPLFQAKQLEVVDITDWNHKDNCEEDDELDKLEAANWLTSELNLAQQSSAFSTGGNTKK